MSTQKSNLVATIFVMLLALFLSACMMGQPMAAECTAEISNDLGLEAQNVIMGAAMTGETSVTLNNSHVSSLQTELLKANMGETWVESIRTCFVEDKMMVSVDLVQPFYGIENLGLTGALRVEDHQVVVDLDEVSANSVVVDHNLTEFIGQRITAALDAPELGTIIDLEMSDGELTLMMAQ